MSKFKEYLEVAKKDTLMSHDGVNFISAKSYKAGQKRIKKNTETSHDVECPSCSYEGKMSKNDYGQYKCPKCHVLIGGYR